MKLSKANSVFSSQSIVIPAEAGIYACSTGDYRFRGNDSLEKSVFKNGLTFDKLNLNI